MRHIALALAMAAAFACGGGAAEEVVTIGGAADCDQLARASLVTVQELVQAVDEHGLEDQVSLLRMLRELQDDLDPTREAPAGVTAFFFADVGSDTIEQRAVEVSEWPGVLSVEVFDKDDALAEARTMFADEPELLALVEADPQSLPGSLRMRVEAERLAEVDNRLREVPGVQQVRVGDRDVDPAGFELMAAQPAATVDLGRIAQRADELDCAPGDVVAGISERAAALTATSDAGRAWLARLGEE